MNIGLSTLTLAMPPGQLKYARLVAEPEAQPDVEMEGKVTAVVGNGTELTSPDAKTDSVDAPTESKKAGGESPADEVDAKINGTPALEDVKPEEEVPIPGTEADANGLVIITDEEGQEPPKTAPEGFESEDSVIHHEIKTLQQLEKRVLEIDGRLNPKEIPSVNAWRFTRCKRNNQDLGTLFEMREDFYVYKYPQIIKHSRD